MEIGLFICSDEYHITVHPEREAVEGFIANPSLLRVQDGLGLQPQNLLHKRNRQFALLGEGGVIQAIQLPK